MVSLHNRFSLTVQEVLARPLFHNARVVAGAGGLHRLIRWVHVLEVTNFDALIHGQEMILSTGIGFQSDASSSVSYLQKLIKEKVSCLCVELGPYLPTIPEEMIRIANLHDFPLLVFSKKVRFVDITQDLHSVLINRHHQRLSDLQKVSREFHRLSLTSQGTSRVLKLLHASTKAQIAYMPFVGQPSFFPALPASEQKTLLSFVEHYQHQPSPVASSDTFIQALHEASLGEKKLLIQPVGAMDQTWALLIMCADYEPDEYDYLALDSAALSLAQDLMRKRYLQEKKLHAENVWVYDLLHAQTSTEEQLRLLVGTDYHKWNKTRYQVCLIEVEHATDSNESTRDDAFDSARFHLSVLLRSIFEQYGFHPYIHIRNMQIAVIALHSAAKDPVKERIRRVFEAVQNSDIQQHFGDVLFRVGVGQAYVELKNAWRSYQEAVQSLSLYPLFKKDVIFFEETGILQLLIHLRESDGLASFVSHHLGPILEEDRSKGSDLLTTLKVFLEQNGSKQLAAQKLFIVRQSLYYRLEKIRELLGEDFMETDKRLALQVALRAYELLHHRD